jgi:import inner membrane translocase subunit TIM21
MYTQVFSRHSHTNHFNHAVKRIKTNPECTDLLGPPESIAAYGHTIQRWRRQAGPTPYISETKDPKTGIQQLRMRFLVKGSKGEGWVTLHMQWDENDMEYRYLLLSLDVEGHGRIILEGAKASTPRSSGTLFGIKWR